MSLKVCVDSELRLVQAHPADTAKGLDSRNGTHLECLDDFGRKLVRISHVSDLSVAAGSLTRLERECAAPLCVGQAGTAGHDRPMRLAIVLIGPDGQKCLGVGSES